METIAKSSDVSIDTSAKETTPDSISMPNEHEALKDVFKTNEKSSRIDEYMSLIWDYAKNAAVNKDKESVIFEAIRLKNRLGSPSLGENPFTRVINYIKINNRMKNDERTLQEMTNGV